MNKRVKLILNFLGLIFITFNCDTNNTIVNVEDNNLLAVVGVSRYPNSSEFHFWGDIMTNKVSNLNFVVLNVDTVFYSEQSYYYRNDNNGFINFYRPYDFYIPIQDTFRIQIHTGVGMISGNEVIPDSISNIAFNLSDTVEVNETLVMTFTGKADYFLVHYEYLYLNEDSSWIVPEDGEIFVTQCEVDFDQSLHPKNGYLRILWITSVNGPIPEENSVPNMSGDGKGYLSAYSGDDIQREFVIGEGYHFPKKVINEKK